MGRERRRAQIENEGKQREPRKTITRRKEFFLKEDWGSWKEATRRRGRHGRNKSSAPLVPPLYKGGAITAHSQHYLSSITMPFALKSNAIKRRKKAEQEKALFYLENKTGLGIFSSGLICLKYLLQIILLLGELRSHRYAHWQIVDKWNRAEYP